VQDAGRDVLFVGLAATEEVYFGSGSLDAPAAVVTASHNPAEYNGLKLCRPGAVALSRDTGLDQIRKAVEAGTSRSPRRCAAGRLRETSFLVRYTDHVHRVAPVRGRRLKVVIDAANGMAGRTAPVVFGALDIDLVPLYFELDGAFPNHQANPLVAENLHDLSTAVVRAGADVGLAFDGDADRCFVVDEAGTPISPSLVTCLIAVQELARHPGASVLHNLISSRAVPETIVAHGGTPIRTPVGHSLIKAEMARTGAVFGGEHSGHYYFRDFWCADSGILAALHVVAMLAASERPLSEIVASYDNYRASGEINTTVHDVRRVLADVETVYAGRAGITIDRLDGLSVISDDWWFNLRPSNTEPLLRLNVEARDDATMADVRDSVLSLIETRRSH
jgi:phosphomannomutase